jgi:hypothetical protein
VTLSRRVEVLFADEEYEELRREANRRGVSFGELVREAARREYLQPSAERRRDAFARLVDGPDIDVGPWGDAKKLIGRWSEHEPKA